MGVFNSMHAECCMDLIGGGERRGWVELSWLAVLKKELDVETG